MKRIIIILLLAVLPVSVSVSVSARGAVQSAWVDDKPVRWRLIAAEIDSTYYAAVQIDMKPGWHTYWRYPGASGIAPEFTFTDSRHVDVGQAVFPAPYFFDDGVGGFNGYEGAVAFAFPLMPKQPIIDVKMSGLIGICREVCVPLQLDASLHVSESMMKASRHKAVIRAALDAQPQKPSAALRISGVTFDGVSLQIVVEGQELTDPSVITVSGPHDVIGRPRVSARHPASYLFEVPAWSKLDHPLIGRKLSFIVRDGAHAIEQEIMVVDHRLLPLNNPMGDQK